MHVNRTERGDDQEIRQDERPTASPGAPKPAAHIGDENPDLNRQRSGERLRYRDGVAHLLLGQPALVADQLLFHLSDKRHGSAEADRAEAQEITDYLADRPALRRRRGRGSFRVRRHRPSSGFQPWVSPRNERHQA